MPQEEALCLPHLGMHVPRTYVRLRFFMKKKQLAREAPVAGPSIPLQQSSDIENWLTSMPSPRPPTPMSSMSGGPIASSFLLPSDSLSNIGISKSPFLIKFGVAYFALILPPSCMSNCETISSTRINTRLCNSNATLKPVQLVQKCVSNNHRRSHIILFCLLLGT